MLLHLGLEARSELQITLRVTNCLMFAHPQRPCLFSQRSWALCVGESDIDETRGPPMAPAEVAVHRILGSHYADWFALSLHKAATYASQRSALFGNNVPISVTLGLKSQNLGLTPHAAAPRLPRRAATSDRL